MRQIIVVEDEAAGQLDRLRCSEFRRFLERVYAVEGAELVPEETSTGTRETALRMLGDKGLLSFAENGDTAEVSYIPSRHSNLKIALAKSESAFPESIQEKQLSVFRKSSGAIFRFPYEEGDGELEVFITDWSPSPAACAVAIHRFHPFIAGQPRQDGDYFTGRYVRHPLTGDLLPVWVADWVKSDFGTGAVLVNPAHDMADLRFGRKVGLPIRFCLVPTGFDGEPKTWPHPPVIKHGTTIKTGPYDGLLVSEAMEEYFRVLERRGLAERYVDYQAGRMVLARLIPDTDGSLLWDARHGRLTDGTETAVSPSARRVRAEDANLLDSLVALDERASVVVVCMAGAVASQLLFLRLLQEDLRGWSLPVEDVMLVHRAQESKAAASEQALLSALLVGAPLNQVAVLKQQVLEQSQRFLRIHQKLSENNGMGSAVGEMEERWAKSLKKVKEAMLLHDPYRAFTSLYAMQKQLSEGDTSKIEAEPLRRYFLLAHVLLGLELPSGIEPRGVWKAI